MNRHWSVLLDQTPLQLEREGMKEREDGERGGVGDGIDYSRKAKIFNIPLKGTDCSREAINRGTANILGNTVYLTIIPRVRMGSESIAHEAEGRMGY